MQILEPASPFPVRAIDLHETLPLPPRLLAALAIQHAGVARFAPLAEPRPGERTSVRVRRYETHDIWLIRWGAGSRTELHDHGGSAGALYVVEGELVEHRANPAGVGRPIRRVLHELEDRAMPSSHIHEIANESSTVTASVHVYSPPLESMQHFELADDFNLRLVRRETVAAELFEPA